MQAVKIKIFTWGGRMSKTSLKQIIIQETGTSNHWGPRW